jgi:hypothetical protein
MTAVNCSTLCSPLAMLTPVPRLARRRFFGDKGYLSRALRDELWRLFNVQLITGIRANMKNMLMPLLDKLLLRRRVIVETIVDQFLAD